jgi:NADPH:quinone reductase
MRAVVLTEFGGPEVLVVRDTPDPEPASREILVRIHATAINRADLHQRQGRYPAPPGSPQTIPGLEFAGEVVAQGPDATRWQLGDRVFGITGGGGYAELIAMHEDAVAAVPAELSWTEAAAIAEAFITVHDALVTQAGLRSGDRVLIHAVGSGVGLAAVQLVRALGSEPYGTSRTADKIDRSRPLGLIDGIVLRDDLGPLADAVARWTGGRGIDIVLDLTGGAYTAASVRALGLKGRLMLVGLVAGRSAEIDLGRVLSQRLTIRGTLLRPRSVDEKIVATRAFERDVVPLIARGEVRAVVDSVFPFDRIADAHRRVEGNETFGKVVVEIRR